MLQTSMFDGGNAKWVCKDNLDTIVLEMLNLGARDDAMVLGKLYNLTPYLSDKTNEILYE